MTYTFKVMTDTLLRDVDGVKKEYSQGDLIEVTSFSDYRNFLNYARRGVIIEVKMKKETKEKIEKVVDAVVDTANSVVDTANAVISTIDDVVDTANTVVDAVKKVASKKEKKAK